MRDSRDMHEAEEARRVNPYLTTWGAWRAVVATVAALAVGLLLSIPLIIIESPGAEDELTTRTMTLSQFLTVFGFLAVPLWVASQAGGGWRAALWRLGLRRFRSSAAGWIALAAVAYIAFTALYASLIVVPEQEDIAERFGPLPLQFLLIVILASVSEEICFRGMLYAGLRNKLGPLLGALIAALLFGGLHATTGLTAVPPLIAFGFILALLYEKTGSLWPAIILHALNNGLALWALEAT